MSRWNWGGALMTVPLALALTLFVVLLIVGLEPWWLPAAGIVLVLARFAWDQRPWVG